MLKEQLIYVQLSDSCVFQLYQFKVGFGLSFSSNEGSNDKYGLNITIIYKKIYWVE